MKDSHPALTPYQWRLFLFLSVATFFEGYDQIALTQILPEFRRDLGVGELEAGFAVAFINVGTILAYGLVRQADRWGRRRVLTITIAGYTLFSLLTGLAPDVWTFSACQFLARIFLIAEWAISMVYAAEEFPAAKRGLMIGLIQAFSSLGAVACAGLVPLLLRAPWGWRTVYFVGTVPLVLLAFARRSLRESARFESLAREASASGAPEARSLFRIFRTPYRKRVLQLALIWGLTYVCTQTGLTFWKEYAVAPAPATGPHLSPEAVGGMVALSAVVAMPLVFAVGWLLDRYGRRPGAVVIFSVTAASCAAAYLLLDRSLLLVALIGVVFGASAVLPVLNAYNTELFPTRLRGDAFAWSNNLLGRIGYVLAPAAVGWAAARWGWGPPVAWTSIGPLLALGLILWWMPETRGRDLDETAALDDSGPASGGTASGGTAGH
jgi:putative MFS transporter